MLVVIIKLLFIILVIMAAFLPIITWVERKQSAVMQDRIGANRADIFGIRILGSSIRSRTSSSSSPRRTSFRTAPTGCCTSWRRSSPWSPPSWPWR